MERGSGSGRRRWRSVETTGLKRAFKSSTQLVSRPSSLFTFYCFTPNNSALMQFHGGARARASVQGVSARDISGNRVSTGRRLELFLTSPLRERAIQPGSDDGFIEFDTRLIGCVVHARSTKKGYKVGKTESEKLFGSRPRGNCSQEKKGNDINYLGLPPKREF